MDSKTKNIGFSLLETLWHILFAISVFYWYSILKIFKFIFSQNNISIQILVVILSIISFFYIWIYSSLFFEPPKKVKNNKVWSIIFKFFFLLLFVITLLGSPILFLFFTSYFRFLFISSHVFLLVILFLFHSKSYLINLIKYAIKRKVLYFLPVFLFLLILNILMSIYTSFSISLEQSKYLFGVEIKDQWWQFFLLSLVNCLCSVIESTGDTNLIIFIALTTIINSILFFVSSLIFTQSITFTIKNRDYIFLHSVRT